MTLITLVGPNGSGKTSTLKKLILELYDCGATIVPAQARSNSKVITPQKVSQCGLKALLAQQGDVTVLLEYKGKTIGITTLGDGWTAVMPQLKYISGCDILICASHDTQEMQTQLAHYAATNQRQLTRIYKVQCKGSNAGPKFARCCDFSDNLTVAEILATI